MEKLNFVPSNSQEEVQQEEVQQEEGCY